MWITSALIRFIFTYPAFALVLWIVTDREMGGPGAVYGAAACAITTAWLNRPRGLRDRRLPRVPRDTHGRALPETVEEKIARELTTPAGARAHGLLVTAAFLDYCADMADELHRPEPAPTSFAHDTTAAYWATRIDPCGCETTTRGPALAGAVGEAVVKEKLCPRHEAKAGGDRAAATIKAERVFHVKHGRTWRAP